jgi:hypothetical protein
MPTIASDTRTLFRNAALPFWPQFNSLAVTWRTAETPSRALLPFLMVEDFA